MTKVDDCIVEISRNEFYNEDESRTASLIGDYVTVGDLEESLKRSFSDYDSDLSSKTYTKEDLNETIVIQRPKSPIQKPILKQDRCRSRSSVRPKSACGILDPNGFDKKRARWLSSSSPEFSSCEDDDLNMNDSIIPLTGSLQQQLHQRSSSRSSHKDVGEENKKKQEKKSNISSFKRSLKLLGFQPEDFHVKEDDSKQSQITRVSPTFSTKLKKRSLSLTSLRNAVSLPPEVLDQYKRETLAKAVYEEWYFKKLELERRQKETNERKEKQRKEVLEKEKEERRLKAEYYFNKWLQLKREEKKREKIMLTKARSSSELLKQFVDKEKAEEAYRLWKAEKDKLYQTVHNPKVKKEREEREKAEKEEKKRIAEAAFRAWKESVDIELKEKLKEKELRKKSEEQRRKREIEERRQNALSSFVAWKEIKDIEVKQKLKEKRLAAEAAERTEKTHLAERAYEAEQAYEEWLDMIEERVQSKNTIAKRRNSLSTSPPWHPGGFVTKIC